jgi:hypothetical protein
MVDRAKTPFEAWAERELPEGSMRPVPPHAAAEFRETVANGGDQNEALVKLLNACGIDADSIELADDL